MSIIATAVRHLIAAGVSGDDLVRAISDMEAELTPRTPLRSKGAIRQERYRERNKTSQSVTSDDSDASPDKESFPQTPFKETNPLTLQNPLKGEKGSRSRVAHRLPPSWQPKPLGEGTGAAEAADRRGDKWVAGQLERFRNHWFSASGANARKADWDAAWRNWLVSGDERAPMQHHPPNQSDFSRLVGNYD